MLQEVIPVDSPFKFIIEKTGITQKQLGELFQASRSQIGCIDTGRRKLSPEMDLFLSKAMRYIFENQEPMTDEKSWKSDKIIQLSHELEKYRDRHYMLEKRYRLLSNRLSQQQNMLWVIHRYRQDHPDISDREDKILRSIEMSSRHFVSSVPIHTFHNLEIELKLTEACIKMIQSELEQTLKT